MHILSANSKSEIRNSKQIQNSKLQFSKLIFEFGKLDIVSDFVLRISYLRGEVL